MPLAVAGSLIAALIGVSITYAASRLLKLRAPTISIGDVRRQTSFAVLLIFVELATIATYRYFVAPTSASAIGVSFQATDVLDELFRSGIVILPPLIILAWSTRQALVSLGIRRENVWKMIGVGVFPSAGFFILLVLVPPIAGARFASLNVSSLYGLIVFLLGGFSEEIVWRGYIQTRLIARSGKLYGWLAASVAFSLWHLPANYRLYGGTMEALGVSLLVQFPLGLAFGYIMIRTQNILPSSIYHVFFNWTPSLFQIPGL